MSSIVYKKQFVAAIQKELDRKSNWTRFEISTAIQNAMCDAEDASIKMSSREKISCISDELNELKNHL
jgi:hypothetical protein